VVKPRGQAALDLAPDKILVNGIAPGPSRTGFANAASSDPVKARRLASMVPLGRIAEPEEIQRLARCCSPHPPPASWTGAVIPIDGGMLAGVHAGTLVVRVRKGRARAAEVWGF
jgi:NAD(P)-dependent dehydrogenase (short-subunit alcohol dehydrogenase family)